MESIIINDDNIEYVANEVRIKIYSLQVLGEKNIWLYSMPFKTRKEAEDYSKKITVNNWQAIRIIETIYLYDKKEYQAKLDKNKELKWQNSSIGTKAEEQK